VAVRWSPNAQLESRFSATNITRLRVMVEAFLDMSLLLEGSSSAIPHLRHVSKLPHSSCHKLPSSAQSPLRTTALQGGCSQRSPPMDELRLLLGLATVTSGKNTLSCEYSSETSLPRKILAMNVPPEAEQDRKPGEAG
jgi:hypothetical protein